MRGIAVFGLIGIVSGCGELLGVDGLRDRPDADVSDASASDASSDPDAFDGCAVALPTNKCAIFPQCGCKSDDNCILLDNGGHTACEIAGSTPLYGYCKGNTCGKGMACIGLACKPTCATDDDCPRLDGGSPRVCVQITTTGLPGGKPIPGAKTCTSGCDFINPSTLCGPNVNCSPIIDDDKTTVPDCLGGAGSGMGPGACTHALQSDCAVGYACTDNSGPNPLACSKYCRTLHEAEDCGSLACVPFIPSIVVDGMEYGSCN